MTKIDHEVIARRRILSNLNTYLGIRFDHWQCRFKCQACGKPFIESIQEVSIGPRSQIIRRSLAQLIDRYSRCSSIKIFLIRAEDLCRCRLNYITIIIT